MICSLCYEEFGSTIRKAVPESPGVVEWKILIFVPVDDEYRELGRDLVELVPRRVASFGELPSHDEAVRRAAFNAALGEGEEIDRLGRWRVRIFEGGVPAAVR